MRKILIVGTVLLVVLVGVYRQRIFIRDPLGKVERNGVRVEGVGVYINYSNDVLLEVGTQRYLVQGWNGMPGVPEHLGCVHWLVCWTEADQAAVLPLNGVKQRAEMSNKEVSFVDENGAAMKVELR
ncbi:MAG TPA: hypothetical protein VK627_02765 [Edaphobacter sp.]|nr:hypothetical protein [Edaphobacter sp.]